MRKGRRPTGDTHGLRLHPDAVRRGTNNGSSKLTDADIYTIRAYGDQGYPQTQIAQAFDISSGNVGYIVRRHTWRHLPERTAVPLTRDLGQNQRQARRTEAR